MKKKVLTIFAALMAITGHAQLSFSDPIFLPLPPGIPFSPCNVEVANVDADPQPEIITANFLRNGVYIFDNSAWGTQAVAENIVRRPDSIPTQPRPMYLIADDFSGDGFNDLAVSSAPTTLPHGVEFMEYSTITEKLEPLCIRPYLTYFKDPRFLISGNFNSVRGKDVFVINPNEPRLRNVQLGYKLEGAYRFCISRGIGCFISDCPGGIGSNIFTEPNGMTALNSDRSIAITDSKSDVFYLLNFNPADMLCTVSGTDGFTNLKIESIRRDRFFYGNSTVTGTNKVRLFDFEADDVNGDGKDDLIASMTMDSIGRKFGGLMVFYQNTAGGFSAFNGRIFCTSEINGDPFEIAKANNIAAPGDKCFLVANQQFGGITVYKTEIVGGKAQITNLGIIGKEVVKAKNIRAVDIDNDGDTDIVTADATNNKIVVFINTLR